MSVYWRAVTSVIMQLGHKPKVEIDIAYGPLVPAESRADNLLKYLEFAEQERLHRKQQVTYDNE